MYPQTDQSLSVLLVSEVKCKRNAKAADLL